MSVRNMAAIGHSCPIGARPAWHAVDPSPGCLPGGARGRGWGQKRRLFCAPNAPASFFTEIAGGW